MPIENKALVLATVEVFFRGFWEAFGRSIKRIRRHHHSLRADKRIGSPTINVLTIRTGR